MGRPEKKSRIEDEIDQNLKKAFDDVANQELPSRFTDLLAQLRSQDDKGQSEDDANGR